MFNGNSNYTSKLINNSNLTNTKQRSNIMIDEQKYKFEEESTIKEESPIQNEKNALLENNIDIFHKNIFFGHMNVFSKGTKE